MNEIEILETNKNTLLGQYLALKDIVNEAYHNFLPSDVAKKQQHAHEVYDLISKSYADQGGIAGSGFKNPDDMVNNLPMWKLSKNNGKVNAALLYKDSDGRKLVAMGTDGTPEGRKAAGKFISDELKHKRSLMEVSGKALSTVKKVVNLKDYAHSFDAAKEFHSKKGDEIRRPDADDKEVLRHPELKDYFYTRDIQGKPYTKMMIGNKGKPITEDYQKDTEQEYGKDSALKPGIHDFDSGWKLDAQIHGPYRAKMRQPKWKESDWNELLQKAHKAIVNPATQSGKVKKKVSSSEALFYSLSKKQGVVLAVHPNDPNNHKKGGLTRIITIPPPKSSYTKPGTQRIVVEEKEFVLGENLFFVD